MEYFFMKIIVEHFFLQNTIRIAYLRFEKIGMKIGKELKIML